MHCPKCFGSNIVKNGHTHYGRQNHKCKDCERQFIFPNHHTIGEPIKEKIRKALLERLSLRGICRVFGVSLTWLLEYMISVYEEVPEDLGIDIENLLDDDLQVAVIQADEAWSFVGSKDNKCWIWVAYEKTSQQVVAFHVGDRSRKSAQAFYDKIPDTLKEKCQLIFTDDHKSYDGVIPIAKHHGGKKFNQNIERLFCTMRHRVSRVVRKNLAFSKKWKNHEMALRYFFWNYNLERSLHY
jgi:IS1 family transposase